MNNNIYKIENNNNGYKSINLDDTQILDLILDDRFNSDSYDYYITDSYKWSDEDDDLEICDFPFITGSIPVISERAFFVLKELLLESNISAIEFKINDSIYYLLNFNKPLKDIINLKKSTIQYFSDGGIMNIDDFVFNRNLDTNIPMFIPEEYKIFTFCNEDFKKIIIDNNLTGLSFEDCKIIL